jgi:hypothetical protein
MQFLKMTCTVVPAFGLTAAVPPVPALVDVDVIAATCALFGVIRISQL